MVLFGAATVAFGISRSFWLTLVSLIVVGASDSISTIIRNTICQLQTPDYIRGRMTSVNQIFFTGGPQLGEVEAGLVAQFLARRRRSSAAGSAASWRLGRSSRSGRSCCAIMAMSRRWRASSSALNRRQRLSRTVRGATPGPVSSLAPGYLPANGKPGDSRTS